MKNMVVGLGLVIILFTLSCTSSLPIVRDEDTESDPLTLSVVSPPDSVNLAGVEVLINYAWNGKKSEFEQRQNAVGGITYLLYQRKFGGGVHNIAWGYDRSIDLQETGIIKYHATSDMGWGQSTGQPSIAIGGGRLMFLVHCEYQDKDGNEHKGAVSNYLEVPVIFAE